MDSPISIRLGQRARQRIERDGLQAADIAIIPAAAGGPKGLILNGIDQWMFGEWLKQAPRQRRLIGASIGAWRMAASAFHDPVAAHRRLAHHYAHQTYPAQGALPCHTRNFSSRPGLGNSQRWPRLVREPAGGC